MSKTLCFDIIVFLVRIASLLIVSKGFLFEAGINGLKVLKVRSVVFVQVTQLEGVRWAFIISGMKAVRVEIDTLEDRRLPIPHGIKSPFGCLVSGGGTVLPEGDAICYA